MTARLLPWLLLAIALLFGKCVYDGRRRAEGALSVAAAENKALQDSLGRQMRRVDTLYAHDTVTNWAAVRRGERMIDSLRKALGLKKTDTTLVSVPVTVVESVLVYVDSAITACRAIVTSCEARVAVRDSLLTAVRWERDMWRRKSQPSLLTKASTALKWIGVGYLIGVTR